MVLLVYVDDIVFASNNAQASKIFKTYLHVCFSIKDLGPLKYFLGIKVTRGSEGIFLCQRKYALRVQISVDCWGEKPVDFLVKENHKSVLATGRLLNDATRYRWLVGKLIYLTITRSELIYAVHILSQFMKSSKEEYMKAAHRVVRYLKGSAGEGIFLSTRNNLQLYGFCDSDWGGCPFS